MSASSYPNWATPPNSPNTSAYQAGGWNPFNQRDVYNQYQQIGQNQYQQSQDWQNQFSNLADYYGQSAAGYGNLVNQQYAPIWNGGGGYTQDMQNNILQSQGLQDVTNQAGDNYLTSGEQGQIAGDPYAAFNMFGGQAKSLSAHSDNDISNLNSAVQSGQTAGNGVVNQARSDYGAAIDPSKLAISSGYMPGVNSTLASGQSALTAAQGDPGLNVTQDYLHQAGMTDQQVQDTAEAAARGVGAQFGATKDQLIANAQAAGTASPLGIASAMGALDRSSAAGQADALTNARLQAQQQQRDAAAGIQNTQLNAGQYRAGLGSQNALAQQGAGIAAATTGEQLRLGAQQNLTQDQLNAAQQTSALGLNNSQFNTGAATNAATQGGNWDLDTGMYNASNAANLMGTAEQNSSNRAQQIAGNRQSTNQYNQQTALGVNQALSQRYQQAYQPWVNAQTEGRQAAVGQQQYAGNQQNTQNQLRLGGWQTGNQGQQGAAQGYSDWGKNEANNGGVAGAIRNTSNIISAVTGGARSGAAAYSSATGHAHGGMIDHNQLIEVGEGDRPEAILPLDPVSPPGHRNKWEEMGARLGQEMGIHHQDPRGMREPISNAMGIHAKHYFMGGVTPAGGGQTNEDQYYQMPAPIGPINPQPQQQPTAPSPGMPSMQPVSAQGPNYAAGSQYAPAQSSMMTPTPIEGFTPGQSATPSSPWMNPGGDQSSQQPFVSALGAPSRRERSPLDINSPNAFTQNMLDQELATPGYKRGGIIPPLRNFMPYRMGSLKTQYA